MVHEVDAIVQTPAVFKFETNRQEFVEVVFVRPPNLAPEGHAYPFTALNMFKIVLIQGFQHQTRLSLEGYRSGHHIAVPVFGKKMFFLEF